MSSEEFTSRSSLPDLAPGVFPLLETLDEDLSLKALLALHDLRVEQFAAAMPQGNEFRGLTARAVDLFYSPADVRVGDLSGDVREHVAFACRTLRGVV